MDASDLNQALKETESLEAWVASVRQFFESYELFYGHGTENPLDEAYWLLKRSIDTTLKGPIFPLRQNVMLYSILRLKEWASVGH